MSDADVIRAWKDRRYRGALSSSQEAGLPAHPAGAVSLPDEQLAALMGGREMHAAGPTMPYPQGSCTGGTFCYPCTIIVQTAGSITA